MDKSYPSGLSRNKLIIIAFTIPLVIAGILGGILYSSPATILGPCYSRTTGIWSDFVIVANSTTGYNNSRFQHFAMNVPQNECVFVTFINTDPVQPHGLAITYYSDGVIAQLHQTASFKFQATKTGTFSVYEQIVSSIAAWTSNAGSLNVHLGVTFHEQTRTVV